MWLDSNVVMQSSFTRSYTAALPGRFYIFKVYTVKRQLAKRFGRRKLRLKFISCFLVWSYFLIFHMFWVIFRYFTCWELLSDILHVESCSLILILQYLTTFWSLFRQPYSSGESYGLNTITLKFRQPINRQKLIAKLQGRYELVC